MSAAEYQLRYHLEVIGADVPSWIAAIGTAGALLITVISLAFERRQRRIDKRAEQARLIDAWAEDLTVHDNPDGHGWVGELRVHVSNTSGQSAHGCSVKLSMAGADLGGFNLGVVPPRQPGHEKVFPLIVDIDDYLHGLLGDGRAEPWKSSVFIVLTFTDALSSHWRRAGGDLEFQYNTMDVINTGLRAGWRARRVSQLTGWLHRRRGPS